VRGVTNIDRLPELARMLAWALNAILLLYLILIASANPSWQLVAAVLFECALFLAITGYRLWRSKSKPALAEAAALASIEQRFRFVYWLRRLFTVVMVTALALACLYFSADAAALLLCRNGQIQAGECVYEVISPKIPGIDPAFSLELLTGAYIERGQLDKAEPLMLALLRIRKKLYGQEHEMVAAIYSNLGDFYSKCGKVSYAEANYRCAIEMTKRLKLKQGWGSPATKLGTLLRDQDRLSEAEDAYLDALRIRIKTFGRHSDKVQETLAAYEVLLNKESRYDQAVRLHHWRESFDHVASSAQGPCDWLPASLLLVVASLFVWQRGRLLVYLSKILQRHDRLSA
jgi:tetratricopeptide (TPR) repeat protein